MKNYTTHLPDYIFCQRLENKVNELGVTCHWAKAGTPGMTFTVYRPSLQQRTAIKNYRTKILKA